MKPTRIGLTVALGCWLGSACATSSAPPSRGAGSTEGSAPPRSSLATTPSTDETADRFAFQVGFLVLDGVYNSELIAPYDIFHHTVFHTKPGMRVFTVGREKGTVRSFEGLELTVDYDLSSAPPIDVLVVPSAEHNMTSDLEDGALIEWLGKRGRAARFMLSVCDGAFLLAEAGLLNGRRSTTFPQDIADFRRRFPQLDVVEGVSFVADGPAITGVGGARSYDPALYLVEHLFGEETAQGVARGMVIDWDLETVRHLALPSVTSEGGSPEIRCYLPGDRVASHVTVEDAEGGTKTLAEIVGEATGVKALVLTILAGGEAEARAHRGGLWCEDSFDELANLRHLILDYADRKVLFVGVLCPPVYHETRFGYDEGAFLTRADDDPIFQKNRDRFVKASMALQENDVLPFETIVFDSRFRLLADPDREVSTEAGGPRPPWQGRFKWFTDSQTYGTPTVWLLSSELEVIAPPFTMNVYESPGRKLRFNVRQIRSVLDQHLRKVEEQR